MNLAPIRIGLQFLIGGIIAVSAVAKGMDLPGFSQVLQTYQAFPKEAFYPLALTITIVELILGAWILWGHQLQTSATLAALMNVGYAGWMALTLLRGLRLPNCGCFGVYFPRPLTWMSPVEDLTFASLCLILSCLARNQTRD